MSVHHELEHQRVVHGCHEKTQVLLGTNICAIISGVTLNPMEKTKHYRAGLRLVVVLISVVAFVGLVLMISPAIAGK